MDAAAGTSAVIAESTATAVARPRLTTRCRVMLGAGLIMHGRAHALPGMRAADQASGWPIGQAASPIVLPVTALWLAAMAGLVAAGLGAVGSRPFDRAWQCLATVGGGSSLLLLAGLRPDYGLPGTLISVLLLAGLWRIRSGLEAEAPPDPRRRGRRRLGDTAAVVFVAYLVATIGGRPWHMRWGSSEEELHMALPGDELDPGHAIVLENWGAFVLLPANAGNTRLIARTRGGGDTTPADLLLGPAGLLLFEVPHFVMQRRMLLGIKALADGRRTS